MASPQALDDLLRVACDLARQGGEQARRMLGTVLTARKPDRSPVTEADHAVQRLILDGIARTYPQHGVLAEEAPEPAAHHPPLREAEYVWVVDPIDGTRNYVRGFETFCTAIAVLHAGRPIVAAIYNPMARRLYSAAAGRGAFADGQPLRVRERDGAEQAVIGVPSAKRIPLPACIHDWIDRHILRNVGSASLHLAYVAAGYFDAAVCHECYIWDVAPGALLVIEAGGVVTDLAGRPLFPVDPPSARHALTPFVAGSPTLHRQILADLRGDAPAAPA